MGRNIFILAQIEEFAYNTSFKLVFLSFAKKNFIEHPQEPSPAVCRTAKVENEAKEKEDEDKALVQMLKAWLCNGCMRGGSTPPINVASGIRSKRSLATNKPDNNEKSN